MFGKKKNRVGVNGKLFYSLTILNLSERLFWTLLKLEFKVFLPLLRGLFSSLFSKRRLSDSHEATHERNYPRDKGLSLKSRINRPFPISWWNRRFLLTKKKWVVKSERRQNYRTPNPNWSERKGKSLNKCRQTRGKRCARTSIGHFLPRYMLLIHTLCLVTRTAVFL